MGFVDIQDRPAWELKLRRSVKVTQVSCGKHRFTLIDMNIVSLNRRAGVHVFC